MGVDTEKMRAEIDAVDGNRVQVEKADLRYLLDTVDVGQIAVEQLTRLRSTLVSLSIAA